MKQLETKAKNPVIIPLQNYIIIGQNIYRITNLDTPVRKLSRKEILEVILSSNIDFQDNQQQLYRRAKITDPVNRYAIYGLNLFGFLQDKNGKIKIGGIKGIIQKGNEKELSISECRKTNQKLEDLISLIKNPQYGEYQNYNSYYNQDYGETYPGNRNQLFPGYLIWLFHYKNKVAANLYAELVHKPFLTTLNWFNTDLKNYIRFFERVKTATIGVQEGINFGNALLQSDAAFILNIQSDTTSGGLTRYSENLFRILPNNAVEPTYNLTNLAVSFNRARTYDNAVYDYNQTYNIFFWTQITYFAINVAYLLTTHSINTLTNNYLYSAFIEYPGWLYRIQPLTANYNRQFRDYYLYRFIFPFYQLSIVFGEVLINHGGLYPTPQSLSDEYIIDQKLNSSDTELFNPSDISDQRLRFFPGTIMSLENPSYNELSIQNIPEFISHMHYPLYTGLNITSIKTKYSNDSLQDLTPKVNYVRGVQKPLQLFYHYYIYGFDDRAYEISLNILTNSFSVSRTINLGYYPINASGKSVFKSIIFASGYRIFNVIKRIEDPYIRSIIFANDSNSLNIDNRKYFQDNYYKTLFDNIDKLYNNTSNICASSLVQTGQRCDFNGITYVSDVNSNLPFRLLTSYDYQYQANPPYAIPLKNFRSFPTSFVKQNINGLLADAGNYIYHVYQDFTNSATQYRFNILPYKVYIWGEDGDFTNTGRSYTYNSRTIRTSECILLGRNKVNISGDAYISSRLSYFREFLKIPPDSTAFRDIRAIPPHQVANKLEFFIDSSNNLYLLQWSVHHGRFMDVPGSIEFPFENGIYYTTAILYKVLNFEQSTEILHLKTEDIIVFPGIGALPVYKNPGGYSALLSQPLYKLEDFEQICVNDTFETIFKVALNYDTSLSRYKFVFYEATDDVKAKLNNYYSLPENYKIGFVGIDYRIPDKVFVVLTPEPIYTDYQTEYKMYTKFHNTLDEIPMASKIYEDKIGLIDANADFTISNYEAIFNQAVLIYSDATFVLLSDSLEINIYDTKGYYNFIQIASSEKIFLGNISLNRSLINDNVVNNDFLSGTPYEINLEITNVDNRPLSLNITLHSDIYIFKINGDISYNLALNPGESRNIIIQHTGRYVGDCIITISKL